MPIKAVFPQIHGYLPQLAPARRQNDRHESLQLETRSQLALTSLMAPGLLRPQHSRLANGQAAEDIDTSNRTTRSTQHSSSSAEIKAAFAENTPTLRRGCLHRRVA
ncbi:hypothetical protein DHEL01_v210147 [Diaporthe helianthi]|uniref:Uncharacterized protein n=1 Tax=Diaporthe helianthi TaxID=158607 RepID=A0A2P5HMI2_DIAHE|nr:hypothetical protein DHEL01_v210147 [Diaporthe helianthi]